MNSVVQHYIVPNVLMFCFALFITGIFWFRSYTALTHRQAFLALLGSIVAAGYRAHDQLSGNFVGPNGTMVTRRSGEFEMYLVAFASGAVIVFLVALTQRLWGRWIGEKGTAEERLPGLPGVRAWFCTSNVTIGLLIVVCAWFGYNSPPLLSAGLVCTLFLASPVLRLDWSATPTPVPVPEDMSPEREKIVAMLEAGKLTADESAELLQALGATRQVPMRQVVMTGGQRLMMTGAALVTVGFFMPWFVVNPGAEATRLMNQMQQSMEAQFGGNGMPMPGGSNLPNLSVKTASLSISGGDIGRGFGWAVLAMALIAALLPYLATALEATAARTVRLLCLGIGALLVVYLLTDNVRYASIGLIIAVGGYVLEIVGMLRDRRGIALYNGPAHC